MLERQRERIQKPKLAGKYRARKRTAQAKAADARTSKAQGLGATEIARRLGIGRVSIYRLLAAAVR
jgi:DNA invertase Pin-like site-specific DNA recombinase